MLGTEAVQGMAGESLRLCGRVLFRFLWSDSAVLFVHCCLSCCI